MATFPTKTTCSLFTDQEGWASRVSFPCSSGNREIWLVSALQHLCPVQDVSTSTFTDQWELVDIDCQACMVAHTSRHLLTSEGVQRIEEYESAENEGQVEAFLASPELQQTPPQEPPHTPQKKGELAKIASKLFAGLSKLVKRSHQAEPSLATTLGDDPDNIEGLFGRFNEGLQDIIRDPRDLADSLPSSRRLARKGRRKCPILRLWVHFLISRTPALKKLPTRRTSGCTP